MCLENNPLKCKPHAKFQGNRWYSPKWVRGSWGFLRILSSLLCKLGRLRQDGSTWQHILEYSFFWKRISWRAFEFIQAKISAFVLSGYIKAGFFTPSTEVMSIWTFKKRNNLLNLTDLISCFSKPYREICPQLFLSFSTIITITTAPYCKLSCVTLSGVITYYGKKDSIVSTAAETVTATIPVTHDFFLSGAGFISSVTRMVVATTVVVEHTHELTVLGCFSNLPTDRDFSIADRGTWLPTQLCAGCANMWISRQN